MGNLISRDGLQSYYGTGWREHFSRSNPDVSLYISAPVFIIDIYAQASGLKYNAVGLEIYYYDFASGTWKSDGHTETYAGQTIDGYVVNGGMGSDNNSKRISHNVSSGYQHNSNNHLWKVRLLSRVGGYAGSDDRSVNIYVGGVYNPNNNNSDTYKSGKDIRFNNCHIWYQSEFNGDSAFVNSVKPSVYIGTPINTGNAFGCYTEG